MLLPSEGGMGERAAKRAFYSSILEHNQISLQPRCAGKDRRSTETDLDTVN